MDSLTCKEVIVPLRFAATFNFNDKKRVFILKQRGRKIAKAYHLQLLMFYRYSKQI